MAPKARALKTEPTAPAPNLKAVTPPPFDANAFQMDDLSNKIALVERENSRLRAYVAEMQEYLKANADLLGLKVITQDEAAAATQ